MTPESTALSVAFLGGDAVVPFPADQPDDNFSRSECVTREAERAGLGAVCAFGESALLLLLDWLVLGGGAACESGPVESGAGTQNDHPGGAGGHDGSGRHPGGGTHPSGGTGQPGAGLNIRPATATALSHRTGPRWARILRGSWTRPRLDTSGTPPGLRDGDQYPRRFCDQLLLQ